MKQEFKLHPLVIAQMHGQGIALQINVNTHAYSHVLDGIGGKRERKEKRNKLQLVRRRLVHSSFLMLCAVLTPSSLFPALLFLEIKSHHDKAR